MRGMGMHVRGDGMALRHGGRCCLRDWEAQVARMGPQAGRQAGMQGGW